MFQVLYLIILIQILTTRKRNNYCGKFSCRQHNYEAPANCLGWSLMRMGIVMPGRVGDVVEKNIVINHDKYGLVASPMLDVTYIFQVRVKK